MWLAAIKREGLTESIIRNQRICSRHFITGKPIPLTDENHPDFVPSQHMGHQCQVYSKNKSAVDPKLRVDNSSEATIDQGNEEIVKGEEQAWQGIEEGCVTQTNHTMLTKKLKHLKFASKKLAGLEKKVETTSLGLMDDINNIHKWKYYTGFDYEFINAVIFPEIEPHVTSTSTTVLSPFNQLLLTLVKLKLNLHFKDLGFCFKVAAPTANIPLCFQEAFQDKTTVIIDCFEVFIEKPENYLTQQQ